MDKLEMLDKKLDILKQLTQNNDSKVEILQQQQQENPDVISPELQNEEIRKNKTM